ncbi:MAG: hypothetical protein H7249_17325 [Chitinophagaceae bacterium]|nr:hypothetical protein [Oligoflexus sp.]
MESRREPVFESEQRKTAPTLAEFAKKSQITEDKVWELIEEGQISARFVNESILIMQDQLTVFVSNASEIHPKEPDFAMEPTMPEFNLNPERSANERNQSARKKDVKTTTSTPSFNDKTYTYRTPEPEMGPLQDYDFSEDSSELLTFAQDALSRTAELSKELLATKNELIRLKDERILFLTDLLQKKDVEIRKLNRNIEELATLNNFETR